MRSFGFGFGFGLRLLGVLVLYLFSVWGKIHKCSNRWKECGLNYKASELEILFMIS